MKSPRSFLVLILMLPFVQVVSMPARGNTTGGLAPGDPIGAFNVVKVAGADDDGVEVGQELCYRCRFGSRPMAMVFVRSPDGEVVNLVKQLDRLVAKHHGEHFRTLVTFLGDDSADLKSAAVELASAAGAKHAAIAVAKDFSTGPINYRVPADADVTIVLARDSQVMEFMTASASEMNVDAIAAKVAELVQEESL